MRESSWINPSRSLARTTLGRLLLRRPGRMRCSLTQHWDVSRTSLYYRRVMENGTGWTLLRADCLSKAAIFPAAALHALRCMKERSQFCETTAYMTARRVVFSYTKMAVGHWRTTTSSGARLREWRLGKAAIRYCAATAFTTARRVVFTCIRMVVGHWRTTTSSGTHLRVWRLKRVAIRWCVATAFTMASRVVFSCMRTAVGH